jgi:acyl carrier protein
VIKVIDTHAHIVKEYYDDIKSLIEELKEKNVLKVINCATSIKDSHEVIELSKQTNNFLLPAIGIHPEMVNDFNRLDELENLIKENEFKLNRKRLSEDYIQGNLFVLDPDNSIEHVTLNDFEQKVADCFYKALDKRIGKDDDFFIDAGGTSMDYFTMISYIQAEFDVIIPLSNEKKMTTISSFCLYLKEKM